MINGCWKLRRRKRRRRKRRCFRQQTRDSSEDWEGEDSGADYPQADGKGCVGADFHAAAHEGCQAPFHHPRGKEKDIEKLGLKGGSCD